MRTNRVRVISKRATQEKEHTHATKVQDAQDSQVPTLLTVEEMAAQLRIGRNSAYNLVKAGEIRSIKIGRTIRIPQSAVTEFAGGGT